MIPSTPAESRRSAWLEIRDEAIASGLRDTLFHDERTSSLDLTVEVKGGVAHITGQVPTEADRTLVRRLIRRQAGLFAAWDLLSLPGQTLELADIGCGGKKQYVTAVGVDRFPAPGVDVVANIDEGLPFADESFDHVFAIHVLEHVRDLVFVMGELNRILRTAGVLHVLTPYWRHVNAVADPTHVRLMDVQTFRYFCQSHPGVLPWRPLTVTATDDTVYADLQPVKGTTLVTDEELARWFS